MAIERLSGYPGPATEWGVNEWVTGDMPTAAEFNANFRESIASLARAHLSGLLAGGVCTASGLDITVPSGTTYYSRVGWTLTDDEVVTVPDEATTYIWACSDGVLRQTDSTAPPSGFDGSTACIVTKAVASSGTAALDNSVAQWARRVDASAREVTEGPMRVNYQEGVVAVPLLDLPEGAAPVPPSGAVRLYAKDISGQPEAFVMSEDASEVQLTSAGAVLAANYVRLDGTSEMTGNLKMGSKYVMDSERVVLKETMVVPTDQSNKGCLVVRDVSGRAELFYVDDAPPPGGNNAIQLTSNGSVLASAYLLLSGGTLSGLLTLAQVGAVLTPRASAGAPASGTWAKGQVIADSNAVLWVCTAAGTPGTWARVGNQADLFLDRSGGTMSGNIAMGSNKLTGLAAGTTAGDSVRYEQTVTRPQIFIFGSWADIGAGLTRYIHPQTGSTWASADYAGNVIRVRRASVLKNMRLVTSGTPSGGNFVLTLRVNGSDTGLVITQSAGVSGGLFEETSTTVTIGAGQDFNYKVVNSASNTITITQIGIELMES